MKTINSKSLLKKQLSKKEFRKEYELLEEEFLIAKEVIRLRLEANL